MLFGVATVIEQGAISWKGVARPWAVSALSGSVKKQSTTVALRATGDTAVVLVPTIVPFDSVEPDGAAGVDAIGAVVL